MKSVLIRLRGAKDTASETEKSIIEYLLKHPEDAMELSIRELADRTFSSPSTIIRMCHRVGFEGFKDFRKAITYELALRKQGEIETTKDITKNDSLEEIIEKVTYKSIVSLEDTKNLLDVETLETAVDIIHKSSTICLFGIGASLCVARDAYLKFLRLNKLCILNDDWHSQLLQARNMTEKDVGIVISYSGQTTEMIECMKVMKNNGASIIAITSYNPSPVAELSDYNLYVAPNEAILRSGAMSSRISQLNIIDILFIAYAIREYDISVERLKRNYIEKP